MLNEINLVQIMANELLHLRSIQYIANPNKSVSRVILSSTYLLRES